MKYFRDILPVANSLVGKARKTSSIVIAHVRGPAITDQNEFFHGQIGFFKDGIFSDGHLGVVFGASENVSVLVTPFVQAKIFWSLMFTWAPEIVSITLISSNFRNKTLISLL